MKVWITKYALTKGIYEIDAEFCESVDPTMQMIKNPTNRYGEYYNGEGKEWHKTKEKAVEGANSMRLDKIKSLKKQIEKLEKMEF